MKFLLTALNAKYIHSNPALYSLRAYAGKAYEGHIEIAEYTINNLKEDILADIYKRKPDVIAFSCYIWNWNMIQELLLDLHKILPQVPIWLGGPEVSFDAQIILKDYPMLTGIMIGEGEQTFLELLRFCLQEEPIQNLQDIKGLWLPTGFTGERELTELTRLPFLYENLEPFTNRIIYYESQRGCPYRCSYCLSSIDKSVRLRDIEIVKKELQFFLDKKVVQVKFVDRTFNCNHKHAMEIWQYIYEHDNGVTNFHFEIAADIITKEEINLLQKLRPGLAQLEIGVQTTNPQTLEAINRRMDLSRLESVVSQIGQGENIHQHLDLIAGLPFEDYESFGRSFNQVYTMKPEQLQLGFLKVLKGSSMHEKAEEYGICYMDKPPYEVLYTRWLPYADVLRLKKVESMVELYYNSNQFRHTLPVLEQAFETAFALYEALADFYEKKGYFVNSPARSYRYEVLLDFAKTYDEKREDLYRELLTYDMYLRENLKSRPSFAKDLSGEKQVFKEFYQKEKETGTYLPAYHADYDSRQMAKMTHLEAFSYPVWLVRNQQINLEKLKKEQYILFDYQVRSPLDGEARTCIIGGDL